MREGGTRDEIEGVRGVVQLGEGGLRIGFLWVFWGDACVCGR